MKILLWLTLLTASCPLLYAQSPLPDQWIVGQPVPDVFLHEINFNSNDSFRLGGKHYRFLILDFFGSQCPPCFTSMPKLNALQETFRDQLQFVLVGVSDPLIRDTYKRFAEKLNLHLTVAFDSVVHQTLDLPFVPYCVWIDSAGIIKAFSTSTDIDSSHLVQFINGEPLPDFLACTSSRRQKYSFNASRFLFEDSNGGPDSALLLRSALGKYVPVNLTPLPLNDSLNSVMPFQFVGHTVTSLYCLAYWHRQQWQLGEAEYGHKLFTPVWKIRDSSFIKPDSNASLPSFNYSVFMKGAIDSTQMFKKMKEDLHSYFGYTVRIKQKTVTGYALRTLPSAHKLLSTGDPLNVAVSLGEIRLINAPPSSLLSLLSHTLSDIPFFLDETGLVNIDITLQAILTDFQDVKSALRRQGLILAPVRRTMEVLEISDKKKTRVLPGLS